MFLNISSGSSVGGIPELVNDKTGILVPSEDPENLALQINSILQYKESSKKITQNAYDFVVNEMSWKKILPKYIEFYEDLLKN